MISTEVKRLAGVVVAWFASLGLAVLAWRAFDETRVVSGGLVLLAVGAFAAGGVLAIRILNEPPP